MNEDQLAKESSDSALSTDENKNEKNIASLANRIFIIWLIATQGILWFSYFLQIPSSLIESASGIFLRRILMLPVAVIMGCYLLRIRPKMMLYSEVKAPSLLAIDKFLLTISCLAPKFVILFLINPLFEKFALPPILPFQNNVFDSILIEITTCVVAPIVEEILCRGIFLRSTQKYGTMFAIVSSALVFAAWHGGIRIFHSFIGGLLYGILFVKTGSIIWPILLHILYNSMNSLSDAIKNSVVFPFGDNGIYFICIVLGCICFFCYAFRQHLAIQNFSLANVKKLGEKLKADKRNYFQYFTSAGMLLLLLIYIASFFDFSVIK